MRNEMNIMAMAKGPERYVFLYDDQSYDTLVDLLERYAADPDMNLTSDDAALLSRKARETRDRTLRTGFASHRDI